MIKNKKAQLATSQLIIILLTVALLVIIILYWPQLKAHTVERLALIIPSLNAAKPPAEEAQIIRYYILQDKVQYYDGVSWIDFPPEQNSEIKLENKVISKQKLRESLATKFYYKTELRGDKLIDIDSEIIEEIYPLDDLDFLSVFVERESSFVYFKYDGETNRWLATHNKYSGPWLYVNDFFPGKTFAQIVPGERETLLLENMKNRDLATGLRIIKQAQEGRINERETTGTEANIKLLISGIQNYENARGYVVSNIIYPKFNNKIFAEITLSNDNKATIKRISSDLETLRESENLPETSEIYKKIVPYMIKWRDSILSTPVAISYYDVKDETEKTEFFCTEKIDNIYLLVRLNNPIEKTEKC